LRIEVEGETDDMAAQLFLQPITWDNPHPTPFRASYTAPHRHR
jgi:hypothetical protein